MLTLVVFGRKKLHLLRMNLELIRYKIGIHMYTAMGWSAASFELNSISFVHINVRKGKEPKPMIASTRKKDAPSCIIQLLFKWQMLFRLSIAVRTRTLASHSIRAYCYLHLNR